MPPSPVAAFLAALETSRLLDDQRLGETRRAAENQIDPVAVARTLVERNWLTRWQATQLLVGRPVRLGPYELLDRLGAGGMGAVYKARQSLAEQGSRLVAIKVMNKQLLAKPEALRRFLREARAMQALSHPNIVAAYDVGTIGPLHFLALEYVAGRDLGEWLKQFRTMPIDWACECTRQAAIGLQHAHERGLVHRDIKPSNILVVAADPGRPPAVKLLDLGLARFTGAAGDASELTETGQVMGTPDYMSAEQAENTKRADIRSDIFSLGCTLFKLLTGELPYKGDSAMEKLIARMKYDAPPVTILRPEASPRLAVVVAKMLARDVNRRYQTPAEVAAALAPFAMTGDSESSSYLLLPSTPSAAALEAPADPLLAEMAGASPALLPPLPDVGLTGQPATGDALTEPWGEPGVEPTSSVWPAWVSPVADLFHPASPFRWAAYTAAAALAVIVMGLGYSMLRGR